MSVRGADPVALRSSFLLAVSIQDTDAAKIQERNELFGQPQAEEWSDVCPEVLKRFVWEAHHALGKHMAGLGGDRGGSVISCRDSSFKHGTWVREGAQLGTTDQDKIDSVGLNFSGIVSQAPTSKCLPTAFAFGRRWYLCAPSQSLQSEDFVPAWEVAQTEAQAVMSMDKVDVPVTVVVGPRVLKQVSGKLRAVEQSVTITLQVFQLRILPATITTHVNGEGGVMSSIALTRPITPFEGDIKQFLADAKRVAADAKKLLVDDCSEWNRQCRHLRT